MSKEYNKFTEQLVESFKEEYKELDDLVHVPQLLNLQQRLSDNYKNIMQNLDSEEEKEKFKSSVEQWISECYQNLANQLKNAPHYYTSYDVLTYSDIRGAGIAKLEVIANELFGEEFCKNLRKQNGLDNMEEMEFRNWEEVLTCAEENLYNLLEDYQGTDVIARETYKSLMDSVDEDINGYTEWHEVAEDYTYTSEEWEKEMEMRFAPIIKSWFTNYCSNLKKNPEEYEAYQDYIDNFFN